MVCRPADDRDGWERGWPIFPYPGLIPRGWRAIKSSSHFIIAKVMGISDLELCDKLEPLQLKHVNHYEWRSRKELERTEVGECMQVVGCWVVEARLRGPLVESYGDIQSLRRRQDRGDI